jgi:6-phosphogluconolactonase
MKKNINIFPEPEYLAKHLAEILFNKISFLSQNRDNLSIVVSGGNTPKLFYRIFAEYYARKIKWENIHLFWSDERCVPPGDPESNYKMVKDTLLNLIPIPADNVHRILGENDPVREAERYSNEILSNVKIKNSLPSFDITFLGLGEDGHTASIFPGQMHLLASGKIC